mmetsp:Transcript_7473/g.31082  ORF Transcript_7473/g.31082 Transcript_7473/m.31082 type:complete len:215 (+) Transcript_7473:2460-3104(+)
MLLTSMSSMALLWSRFMRFTSHTNKIAMKHSTLVMISIVVPFAEAPRSNPPPFSLVQIAAPSVGIANPVSASLSSCAVLVPASAYVTVVNAPSTDRKPSTLPPHSNEWKYRPMPTPNSPSSFGPVLRRLYGRIRAGCAPPASASRSKPGPPGSSPSPSSGGSSSLTHRTCRPAIFTPKCARSSACDMGMSSTVAAHVPVLVTFVTEMPLRSHCW